jgi:prolyl 4-hydroxylase
MQASTMNENVFDDNWKIWIWSNIGRGCAKDGVFKILHDKGFDYQAIKQELNYEPSVDLDKIENPLTDESGRSRRFFVANSQKINTDRADLYTIDDFLNEEECQHIIELMQHDLRPSTITDENQPDKYFRTINTFDFINSNDPLAAEIDIRISRMLGINPSFSEAIQGQIYDVGEEFKAHTDWFTPGTDEFQQHAGQRGQRSWTFMIYLNDVEAGGETEFVEIGETITPKAGKAVFWNNLHPDGQPNQDTMHHALPVKKGSKAVITKWFRANGMGEMDIKTDAELVPNFTTRGFKKSKVPKGIYQELKSFLDKNKALA